MKKMLTFAAAASVLLYCAAPVLAYADSPVGWASYNDLGNNGTTGGAGGPTKTVSDEPNFVTYATSVTPGPYIVQVQGTINLTTARVDISPNKTIIGIGANPTINGPFHMRVRGQNTDGDPLGYNVIIRNLTIKNVSSQDKDGITIQDQAHHVWIDHCTISACTDGGVDITHACDYITVSWNRFYNQDKVSLLGHSNTNGAEDVNHLKVTYHHNYFDGTGQRHPRVRFSFLCHVYNNYYNDGAITLYGIASTCDAYVLAEGNYFKNMLNPMYSIAFDGNPNGWLVERDNFYDNSGAPQVNPPPSMPEPSTYYSYILDDAVDVPDIVQAYAGAENPYPPHWFCTLYGDFDQTGGVSGYDLGTFADYWLDTTGIDDADYFDNGIIDGHEFALFAQNWMQP